jgi:hypothetical protein
LLLAGSSLAAQRATGGSMLTRPPDTPLTRRNGTNVPLSERRETRDDFRAAIV